MFSRLIYAVVCVRTSCPASLLVTTSTARCPASVPAPLHDRKPLWQMNSVSHPHALASLCRAHSAYRHIRPEVLGINQCYHNSLGLSNLGGIIWDACLHCLPKFPVASGSSCPQWWPAWEHALDWLPLLPYLTSPLSYQFSDITSQINYFHFIKVYC